MASILAVTLVLAAAVVAVWFDREQVEGEPASFPVADSVEPSTLIAEPTISASSSAPVEVAPSPEATSLTLVEFDSESTTPFLTDAELTGIEYREASLQAQVLFNRFTDQYVVRSRLVFLDRNAYADVLTAIASGDKEFDHSFALDIFPDQPCTISSFDHTLGGRSGEDFSVANSICDGGISRAWIYKGDGVLVFRVLSGTTDLQVARLAGINAFVAFEVVTHRNNPITTF